ncbi:plasminogen-binding protein pgbB [Helicobacter muridarum]|nr:plasminogen-binding protein pgbB [Helicobacter muridarum]
MKHNHNVIFALAIILTIIFVGCNSKKYFKPEFTNGKIEFNSTLEKPITQATRVNARLKNDKAVLYNARFIKLYSNQNVLFQDDSEIIATNGCAGIDIIPYNLQQDTNTIEPQESKAIHINTQICVISASKKDNMVAGILADNTLFLYDIEAKQMIFQEKSESIYAISSLNANPIFLDTLVIFPTLDGRLSTLDIKQKKIVRNIIVNTEKFLNNIIYLKVEKDELISATPKKIYTLIRGESYSIDMELRDVYFDGNFIYTLNLNGIIYQLDKTLAIIKSTKLPYANLNGIIIKDNKLYTLESNGGFLIALDLNNFNYDVFKLSGFKKNATIFYNKDTFFINNKELNLSKNYHTKLYERKPKKESKEKYKSEDEKVDSTSKKRE